MSKGLTAFHQRTAYELRRHETTEVKKNLPLPEGRPDGYTNQLSDLELLSFMNLWATLSSRQTESSEDVVLSRPFDYNALILELNAPRIEAEAFELYKDESHAVFIKWTEHKSNIDSSPEATFDFTTWPTVWPELGPYHLYNLLEQCEGKSADDGYFTHFEDIPLTAPLMRHFVMRMLQYARKMTFPPRSGQKCNLWRQARKLLLSDPFEYRLQREAFPETSANLAYSDLPWACLDVRHRYFILLALLRYAVRISSTVHNKIVQSINNKDYGIRSEGSALSMSYYNPLVPLTNLPKSHVWLLIGSNISEYHFIKQDKENPAEINYIGSNETCTTATDLFDDYVNDNGAKNDIRSVHYPPKVEKFAELVNNEEKRKMRQARHQRNMEKSLSMFGQNDSIEESIGHYSRSGRPLRSTRRREREPSPPPVLPTRAERAADRAKKILSVQSTSSVSSDAEEDDNDNSIADSPKVQFSEQVQLITTIKEEVQLEIGIADGIEAEIEEPTLRDESNEAKIEESIEVSIGDGTAEEIATASTRQYYSSESTNSDDGAQVDTDDSEFSP